MRTAVSVVALVLVASNAPAQSTARTVRLQSQTIGLRTFAVLLPAGYDETDRRYPVLYLLHGGGQDHTAFMARREFAKRARTVEMIVVMPAADRGSAPAWMVTQYEDFLATELAPYIDANYRTTASAQGRAIAGLSMGGMYAVGTGTRHAGVFGIVGAFSPAAPRADATAPPGDSMQYFYVSCGQADSLLPVSRKLAATLAARNVAHEYHEIPGFGHAWDFWDPQIDEFFRRLTTRPGWRRVTAAP
jgi:S-formylglutathione hydrolase FrmB